MVNLQREFRKQIGRLFIERFRFHAAPCAPEPPGERQMLVLIAQLAKQLLYAISVSQRAANQAQRIVDLQLVLNDFFEDAALEIAAALWPFRIDAALIVGTKS